MDHWSDISSACRVLWFEFDPVGTLGPREDLDKLISLLAESNRVVHVYDNVGHHMLSTQGDAVRRVLSGLTDWLRQRRQGVAPVRYFDIWATAPELDGVGWG